MKAHEYRNYVAAVNTFLTRNEIAPGCHSLKESESESFFSWSRCECCGRDEGGMRETYVFNTVQAKNIEADICTDCVYFLAYGKLDDATMTEVEASEREEQDNTPEKATGKGL